MPDRQRVLILGGTSEAVDLANAVTDRFDITYRLPDAPSTINT